MCGCVGVQWTDYRELCNICAKHMLVRSGGEEGGLFMVSCILL